MVEIDRFPTLADLVWSDPGFRKHVKTLYRAKRFVFDYDASLFLGELVAAIGLGFINNHEFARVPYPDAWVEIDHRAYWRGLMDAELASDGDEAIGHLFRGNLVEMIVAQGDEVRYSPVAFQLHTPPGDEELEGMAAYFGVSRREYEWTLAGYDQLTEPRAITAISDMAASHRLILAEGFTDTVPAGDPDAYKMFKGGAGDLKRIVSILLLLCRPGRAVTYVDVPKGSGIRRGRRVVYMEHHNVRIRLERSEARTYLESLETGIRHRRHEVRGHWCQTRRADCARCDHVYDRIDERSYVCIKCGGKRWWKKSHERGDAGIGYVEKSYDVTR